MTELPLPKYHELMRPMLEAVTDGEPHHVKAVIQRMMDVSGLTAEQLAETIPSGQPKFRNRSLWAATYLRKAQALSTPKRGNSMSAAVGCLRNQALSPSPGSNNFLAGRKPGEQTGQKQLMAHPSQRPLPRLMSPRRSRSPQASVSWKPMCEANCCSE